MKWFAALSSQIEEKVRRKKTYEVYGKETRGKKNVCILYICLYVRVKGSGEKKGVKLFCCSQ